MQQNLLLLARSAARVTLLALALLASVLLPQTPLHAQLDPATPPAVGPASVNVVVPLSGVVSISAGGAHTCAATSEGIVYCWGVDNRGQLGDGPENSIKLRPVPVVNLTAAAKVYAGFRFTCATDADGSVFCWGENSGMQLGSNVQGTQRDDPVAVPGASNIATVSGGGDHTCAVTAVGSLVCWGADYLGQLGNDETLQSSNLPVAVQGLSAGVESVGAGRFHTCALLTEGSVRCWGANDNYGPLGIGPSFGTFPLPTPVVGITNTASAVAAGAGHSCALLMMGSVLCWGDNAYGQVGYGATNQDYYIPGEVTGITDATVLAAGDNHNCAIVGQGDVVCWGRDNNGQLGDGGTNTDQIAPVAVVGLAAPVVALAGGGDHTCALLDSGVMQCWGADYAGQLGNDLFQAGSSTPVTVTVALTCHALTTSAGGPGAALQVSPAATTGCPAGHFVAGRTIQLTAAPAVGARVSAWSNPPGAALGATSASLTMPAGDTQISVTYEACHTLTLSASGNGQPPVANPDRSTGCPVGQYAAGEPIALTASPNANHRVKAWSNTTVAPGVGQLSNAVAMPAGPLTVSATYETCHLLTTTFAGSGQPIAVSPAASTGCPANRYVAGQALALVAAPAAGSVVASWSGTLNDAAASAANQAVMPNGATSIAVTYALAATPTPPTPTPQTPTPTPQTPTPTVTPAPEQTPDFGGFRSLLPFVTGKK